MSHIGKYLVPIKTKLGQNDKALLESAQAHDMNAPNFKKYPWPNIWALALKTEWEGFVKLSYEAKVLGLLQYAVFPEELPDDDTFIYEKQEGFVKVEYLEAVKDADKRLVDPIGQWLMWYATQVALTYCKGNKNGTILGLLSEPESIGYYKDTILMEGGSLPDEHQGVTLNAFKFSQCGAEEFCERVIAEYGEPISASS